MNYDEFEQSLLILTSRASAANGYVPPTDFVNILPRGIEYAEDRIYKDLTFLGTRAQDSSLVFTGNTRSLNLSNMTTIVLVPEGLSIITPAGQIPSLGRRVPTTQTSLDFIDWMWPTESLTVDPLSGAEFYWALKDDHTMVVAPTPNGLFSAEITGLFQPARISETNPNTYLSLNYPALLEAGAMVYMSGYTRNFGAQADTPQMAQSWETQYGIMRDIARGEEQRRRGQGQGWSQSSATPLAQSTPAQQRT